MTPRRTRPDDLLRVPTTHSRPGKTLRIPCPLWAGLAATRARLAQVFPPASRGTLDVRARTITDEMCIAAAEELALVAEEKGLDEEHIVPTMDEIEVFVREAVAVALKAIDQGFIIGQAVRDANDTIGTFWQGRIHIRGLCTIEIERPAIGTRRVILHAPRHQAGKPPRRAFDRIEPQPGQAVARER